MAVIETWFHQDLQEPVKVNYLNGNLFSNNGNGNRIGVVLTNNGEDLASISGTVSGYVVTADGSTVPCTGSKSGNRASILIPAAAYQPGSIFITVFVTDGTTVTTIGAVCTTVMRSRTNAQVDPGTAVTDWTQTINSAMQSVETAAANLGGIVATPYASLTYPVPLGKYTYYNGNLYRCISPIATSETFTPAHWTAVKLGDDVSDLKSAFNKALVNEYSDASLFESGGISSANGGNTSSSTRLRTITYLHDEIISVRAASGYKYIIVAYDGSGTYVGMWDSVSKTLKTSATWLTGETSLIAIGSYKFRLVFALSNDGTIDTSAATNMTLCELEELSMIETALAYTKEDVFGITVRRNGNLFNFNDAQYGFINNSTGEISASSSWVYSPTYVPVTPGETLYISGAAFVAYYNQSMKWVGGVSHASAGTRTVINDAYYVRFSFNGYSPNHYVIRGSSANDPGEFEYSFVGGKPDKLFGLHPSINDNGALTVFRTKSQNAYNYYDRNVGYIDPSTGEIASAGSWRYSPTYTKVNPGDILRANFTGFYAFYDKNGRFISGMSSISGAKTVPAGCHYLRISSNGNDPQMCVTINDEDTNKGMYSFEIEGLGVKPIRVGKSATYDYQSFTEAVYKNRDNTREIIVFPGEYDITAEYIALFGEDVIASMTDTTDLNGFQMGIVVENRKITFMDGAKLVCDWSDYTISGTKRFSVFMCGVNCELYGLDLEAKGTFYVIHEDAGGDSTAPYEQRLINCRVIGSSIYNGQCLGGGCGIHSRHIIENCYMDNGDTSANSLTGRYHNTGYNNGTAVVIIKDSWFNGKFKINSHGSTTSHMNAYVSGCYAGLGIEKGVETPGSSIDNVTLVAWNNVTQ